MIKEKTHRLHRGPDSSGTIVPLYLALCAFFLIPFLYTCVRTHLIANIPGTDGLGIAGHLEWYDLIDETLLAFLTIPLYSLFSAVRENTAELRTRIWSTFAVSAVLYTLFSVAAGFAAGWLVRGMAGDGAAVTTYLQLETAGFVLAYFASFSAVVFTSAGKPLCILALTVIRAAASICGDLFLIPRFGVNGVAFSNIAVNLLLSAAAFVMLWKCGLKPAKPKLESSWMMRWAQVGLFSGGQILLDNIVYALIVVRMVNAVSEQGNYWVANNFIWGLLLVPTAALVEIIRRENTPGRIKQYLLAALVTAAVWIVSVPLWRPFLVSIMGISQPSPILAILYQLVPFYIAYNVSAVFAAMFVASGRTIYNFVVSIIVNIGYYGTAYLLFQNGVFTTGISFICRLFGFGMVVNAAASACLWVLDSRLRTPTSRRHKPKHLAKA